MYQNICPKASVKIHTTVPGVLSDSRKQATVNHTLQQHYVVCGASTKNCALAMNKYSVHVWPSHTWYSKNISQPGKLANPARGQLNRENEHFPVPVRAR